MMIASNRFDKDIYFKKNTLSEKKYIKCVKMSTRNVIFLSAMIATFIDRKNNHQRKVLLNSIYYNSFY